MVDHGKISNNHGGNGKGAVKQQNAIENCHRNSGFTH